MKLLVVIAWLDDVVQQINLDSCYNGRLLTQLTVSLICSNNAIYTITTYRINRIGYLVRLGCGDVGMVCALIYE